MEKSGKADPSAQPGGQPNAFFALPDASIQTNMPLHAPKPVWSANAGPSPAHVPSPLRQGGSLAPPSYERVANTGANAGPLAPSSNAAASRLRSHSDSSMLHGRQSVSEEHEMTGFLATSDMGHSAHSHTSSRDVFHQNDFGPVSYAKGREKVTITLTANMTLPCEDEVQPAGRRAGYILSTERREALGEMDSAKFTWFHFKVCLIAGVGFFTDAYDIFAINIASTLLDFVYNGGKVSTSSLTNVLKVAAPLGTFIGQVLFGWLGDRAGRKRMYGVELIIIIIGTFGQSLAANGDVGTVNIYAAMIVWRFVMGVGIGGDYPLSAVISSEFASSHVRGRMMTAVFANQGWGQFSAALVGFCILTAFKNAFPAGGLAETFARSPGTPAVSTLIMDIDRTWRILVGLGCVPATIALYFRLTIPETPRFTMDIERNVKQATQDIDAFLNTGTYTVDKDSIVIRVMAPRASWDDFMAYFGKWSNAKILFGCAYAWFAVDVSFYGIGLNTEKFFASFGFAPPLVAEDGTSADVAHLQTINDVFTSLIHLALANMLFSGVGLIPGYWATFALIEKWGRKRIQMLGFAFSAVIFLVIGLTFDHLKPASPPPPPSSPLFAIPAGAATLLFLFCLAAFFQNFGANTTSFVIPGEVFPTRYRSTCHGLSAASGKVGAILSQFFIVGKIGSPSTILLVFIPFMVTGFLATLLIPETTQRTLEELSNERQDDFITGPMRQRAGSV